MDVYIYNAAMLCEECGELAKKEFDDEGVADTGDSDAYPQGPHADGGGEADSPQHCDQCNIFLENPLTSDGYTYVAEAVMAHLVSSNTGNREVLREWVHFYNLTFRDLHDYDMVLEDLLK